MSDAEKSSLIAEFSAVTGVDADRARFYLESAQWKLDVRFYFMNWPHFNFIVESNLSISLQYSVFL